jgi:hypothetical protein
MVAFAALQQNGAERPCSDGFGWGYSEKVPTASGIYARVELAVHALNRGRGGCREQQTRRDRTYLPPIRASMHKPIGGGSLLAAFQSKSMLVSFFRGFIEEKSQQRRLLFQDYSCVHGFCAVWISHHGVQIQLFNLWMIHNQL